ncbi:MAG: methylated-DNA--[protein]-cysteine S-methyltransferase [Pseudomonadota bacterium]
MKTAYFTSFGPGYIHFEDGLMTAITLPRADRGSRAASRYDNTDIDGREAPRAPVPAAVYRIRRKLERYFRGEPTAFTPDELPLDWDAWTPFQRDVARTMLEIPWGETASYAELAAASGHAGAHRAVGNFMAANPFPVVFPCHRVVRSDGRTGRYSAGHGWKERLLALEGAEFGVAAPNEHAAGTRTRRSSFNRGRR